MKKLFVILGILTMHTFSYSMVVCFIDVNKLRQLLIEHHGLSNTYCNCGAPITSKRQFIEHIKTIKESQEKLSPVVVKKNATTLQGKNPKK